jgi:hypothetical protein
MYRVGSIKISLRCDVCDQSITYNIKLSTLDTMRELWLSAKRQGWTSTSENHYCQACK